MKPIVFDPREDFKKKGTAGRVPQRPWKMTCDNCEKEEAFKIERNGVLIVDRQGVRQSDMYKCIGCGLELYEVAQYMDGQDGWSLLESHKHHYPRDVRYIDIDQQENIQQIVDSADVTQPTQRLSSISLMLSGVWQILNNMLEQAKVKGDMNQYDINKLMGESVDLRDKVHVVINALQE